MSTSLPPPPKGEDKDVNFDWLLRVKNSVNTLLTTLHNGLQGLQGGNTTERYHLSSARYTSINSGITTTIITAKVTSGGVDGSMTFTNGILTSQTQAT